MYAVLAQSFYHPNQNVLYVDLPGPQIAIQCLRGSTYSNGSFGHNLRSIAVDPHLRIPSVTFLQISYVIWVVNVVFDSNQN